jgi:mitochondrial chaperone BCS1
MVGIPGVNNILITGGLLSFAGTLVYQLKDLPKRGWNKIRELFVYTVYVYQYDTLFYMLEEYLYNNYPDKYRKVEALFEVKNILGACLEGDYIASNEEGRGNKKTIVKYRQESTDFVVKYNGKKLYISKTKEKQEKVEDMRSKFFASYQIVGYRAKNQISNLLNNLAEEHDKRKKSEKIQVKTFSDDWYFAYYTDPKPLERIILQKDLKEDIIRDIKSFEDSKNWYKEVCIAYKRGYLLYGPPGTGKTSLAGAIAKRYNKCICPLILSSLSDDSKLIAAFSNLPEDSILLIEDIDAAFSGRESKDKKLSFSTLLNCLDGIGSKEGIITIITTNHIDTLDPALLRSGRCDRKIEIPNPTEVEVSEYLSLFYNRNIKVNSLIRNFNMAEIQEICISNKDNIEEALKLIGNGTI